MKGNQKYRIEMQGSLINSYSKIMIALYLPLIGTNACCLYLLLASEKQVETYSTLERLCGLTGMDIERLEESIVTLEQFSLLRTFQAKDKYLFELKSPLSGKAFFSHEIFSRMYLSKVGQKEYTTSKKKYCTSEYDKEGFQEITHALDLTIIENWDKEDEQLYQDNKQKEPEIAIDFDYQAFSDLTTELILPVSQRSDENLKAIGRLGTLYCVDPKTMRGYVKKSMDYENEKLDLDKLKSYCLNSKKVEVKQLEDPYQLSPVAFLYQKQQVPVSAPDKKLLEYLQVDCHFSNEVANYLIEYTLKNTDGKLNKGYVEKVATTWVRQGVDSKEKAIEVTTAPVNSKSSSTGKKKTTFSAKEMEVADQDLEALREQMFGKKGE